MVAYDACHDTNTFRFHLDLSGVAGLSRGRELRHGGPYSRHGELYSRFGAPAAVSQDGEAGKGGMIPFQVQLVHCRCGGKLCRRYVGAYFFATVPGSPPFPATVELYLSLS